ncbi:hypothetical protein K491DRAFT_772971 [Lophiostoma macrostomum CBS 122681]|uniref:Uncharacterized protein n=1 Tax=Lophiostoma macrostomum CBS 122681 TaxID=1314788 RepID=A0A6A6TRE4_9PLEO|nr:hypothetical protein K491DRAFT_772971 [Lophiostoma macrostomum CBS 122681]
MSPASESIAQRRFTVLFDPRDASRAHGNDDHADKGRMKRPVLTRSGPDSSLEGSPTTPNPEERREGFTWGIPEDECLRRPSAAEPKGTANPSRHAHQRITFDMTNPVHLEKLTPLIRRTSSNLFEKGFARHETIDSFSSIRRQGRRALPDIGVFNPGDTHKPATPQTESHSKTSKIGRNLTFMVPALKKRNSADSRSSKPSKKSAKLDIRDAKPKGSSAEKPGLKDRRKLGQTEAMKLTLPMELPDIPARSRTPILDAVTLSDLARPRRHSPTTPWVRNTPPSYTPTSQHSLPRFGKPSSTKTSRKPKPKSIASIPVPPTFIPPEVQRVPTPPIFQPNGEVKGKLADFYFDQAGTGMLDMGNRQRPSKPSPSLPAGTWDSDALLMSQKSEITPPDSDSHDRDSPTRLSAMPSPSFSITPADYAKSSSTGYVYTQFPRPSLPHPRSAPLLLGGPSTPPDFFRVQMGQDDNVEELQISDEERAKLEWVLAEHLPNSPLCPLHVKYHGINVETCP